MEKQKPITTAADEHLTSTTKFVVSPTRFNEDLTTCKLWPEMATGNLLLTLTGCQEPVCWWKLQLIWLLINSKDSRWEADSYKFSNLWSSFEFLCRKVDECSDVSHGRSAPIFMANESGSTIQKISCHCWVWILVEVAMPLHESSKCFGFSNLDYLQPAFILFSLTPRSYISTLFPRSFSIIVFSEIPISYSCTAHDGYVAIHDSILLEWVYYCVKINILRSCKLFNNSLLSNPEQHFRN